MTHSIPSTLQEIMALRQSPTNTETVVRAMVGVVQMARAQGQSLEDLLAEVAMEDHWLSDQQRSRLCEMLKNVWHRLPTQHQSL
ncbi:MAG: hypothetical protein ACO4CG_13725 [Prochlorothrix sp.]|nr:hypothetical protein [Prochlorothrix sp.]